MMTMMTITRRRTTAMKNKFLALSLIFSIMATGTNASEFIEAANKEENDNDDYE